MITRVRWRRGPALPKRPDRLNLKGATRLGRRLPSRCSPRCAPMPPRSTPATSSSRRACGWCSASLAGGRFSPVPWRPRSTCWWRLPPWPGATRATSSWPPSRRPGASGSTTRPWRRTAPPAPRALGPARASRRGGQRRGRAAQARRVGPGGAVRGAGHPGGPEESRGRSLCPRHLLRPRRRRQRPRNVLGPDPDDERVEDAVLALALELGGTISAEHGVGVAKALAGARSRPRRGWSCGP